MNISVPAWIFNDGHFSSEFCDEIVTYCNENLELNKANIGPTEELSTTKDSVRSSTVGFIYPEDDYGKYIHEVIRDVFIQYNQYFDFVIDPSTIEIQYTTYHAEDNGHYSWHTDSWHGTQGDNPERKLSMTFQLSDSSDYEGGEFETDPAFISIPSDAIKDKGTIVVFPSLLRHRVNKITKGTRRSLVAWCGGPNWR